MAALIPERLPSGFKPSPALGALAAATKSPGAVVRGMSLLIVTINARSHFFLDIRICKKRISNI